MWLKIIYLFILLSLNFEVTIFFNDFLGKIFNIFDDWISCINRIVLTIYDDYKIHNISKKMLN